MDYRKFMNISKRKIKSWNRFEVSNFIVEIALLDSFHEFLFDEHTIRISLPSKKDIPEKDVFDESDYEIKLGLAGAKIVDGKEIPTEYAVYQVDVSIVIPDKINISQEFFENKVNPYTHFIESQKNHFDKLAEKYYLMAERVFDLWLRILRWKCNNPAIGRPNIDNFGTGYTELIDKETQKYIWGHNQPLALFLHKAVTLSIWSEIETALKDRLKSPVFFDFLFDAIEHLNNGDLQRSIVDTAVSCECLLRIQIMKSLPNNLNGSIKKFVDDANIRQVVTKFFPELLSEDQRKAYKKIESTLHQLFDKRNTILHSGKLDDLSEEECKKFINVTRNLISICDTT